MRGGGRGPRAKNTKNTGEKGDRLWFSIFPLLFPDPTHVPGLYDRRIGFPCLDVPNLFSGAFDTPRG